MDQKKLKSLLQKYKKGKTTLDHVLANIRALPFDDIEFAKIDTHRALRRGFPEVIFGQGKTPTQIVKICSSLRAHGQAVLITRTDRKVFTLLKKQFPKARFHAEAKAVTVADKIDIEGKGTVLVVSAGTSDIPVAEEAAVTAEIMGNQVERLFDVGVAGLHRLLGYKEKIFSARVIIVVAGMEGALPSVVGGLVSVPVIAVPTSTGYGASLKGFSALLAMLNSCASGITVVNIDNGFGAGYAASLMNRLP
ncbi:nickel pincer cofactor biosynthesis protein LarB [Acidobacteriota bacterium]